MSGGEQCEDPYALVLYYRCKHFSTFKNSFLAQTCVMQRRQVHKVKPRQPCFDQAAMLAWQNDEEWRAQFRMSRATFHALDDQLAPALQQEGMIFGAVLSVSQQLAACLMLLAYGSCYGAVPAAMNSSKSTAMR
jgi:hypothetical protein